METNPPRNNRSQTHPNDGTRGEAEYGLAPPIQSMPNRMDRSAYALKTHTERLELPVCIQGDRRATRRHSPLAAWPGPSRHNGPIVRRH